MTTQERLTVHQKYRFSVDDFLLLAGSGAFRDHARTELIEGEILAVNAIQALHARAQAGFHVLLANALADSGSDLRTYLAPSIAMGGETMPEPDIVVAGASSEDFLPLALVKLVVEISDTTLAYDLGRKAALYARHNIREYWVADIKARVIHQMWSPTDTGFAERREVKFGERIEAATIEGLAVETAGI